MFLLYHYRIIVTVGDFCFYYEWSKFSVFSYIWRFATGIKNTGLMQHTLFEFMNDVLFKKIYISIVPIYMHYLKFEDHFD